MPTPKMSQVEFLRRAKEVHGTRYSYAKVKYTSTRDLVTIVCKLHGEFEQKAGRHLKGAGCPKCGRDSQRQILKKRVVIDETTFLRLAFGKFGTFYSYGQYLGWLKPIEVSCPAHGTFLVRANKHIASKFGCPSCGRNRRTTEEFIRKAKQVHGIEYTYDKTNCTKVTAKVTITCKQHGDFSMTQRRHLNGAGCPGCASSGKSKIAMTWLRQEIKRRRLRGVQHAENGGEYRIPGTKFRADGYHPRSNTIFEFYGDMFHGNLKRYGRNEYPNPYSNLTTKQLHAKTMKREQQLIDMGYTVISMWESDFKQLLKGNGNGCPPIR